jgi:hypothetical protein
MISVIPIMIFSFSHHYDHKLESVSPSYKNKSILG